MPIFGFDDIEEKWIEETTNPKPVDFPEDFYRNTAGYVVELKRELEHSEELKRELLEEELRQVLRMVQEIHSARSLKMMKQIAREESLESSLEEEQRIFDEIKENLRKLHKELVLPAMEGRAELRPPREIANVPVLISSEIEEPIIGDDMRNYGPFEGGEIANLPKRSAEILVQHGLAKKLKIRGL